MIKTCDFKIIKEFNQFTQVCQFDGTEKVKNFSIVCWKKWRSVLASSTLKIRFLSLACRCNNFASLSEPSPFCFTTQLLSSLDNCLFFLHSKCHSFYLQILSFIIVSHCITPNKFLLYINYFPFANCSSLSLSLSLSSSFRQSFETFFKDYFILL